MKREAGPEITTVESNNRKLAYSNEFRGLLKENPGAIKTGIELADKAVKEYNPKTFQFGKIKLTFDYNTKRWLDVRGYQMNKGRGTILVPGMTIIDEKTGMEVTVLGVSGREFGGDAYSFRTDRCDYLKVRLQGNSFFVKRSFVTTNPGFIEFKNTVSAKELLKDLDFVRVVDAQLGYQDKNESWYISKWEDLKSGNFNFADSYGSLNEYGDSVGVPDDEREISFLGFENEAEYYDVEAKTKIIKERLKESNLVADLRHNLFYSHILKTFVLLDVTKNAIFGDQTNMVGNPMKEK